VCFKFALPLFVALLKWQIMTCCIILRNMIMIVEDERGMPENFWHMSNVGSCWARTWCRHDTEIPRSSLKHREPVVSYSTARWSYWASLANPRLFLVGCAYPLCGPSWYSLHLNPHVFGVE
jgi:hypothetical protein